ncbi:MAG: transposase [Acidobacteriota bacterium]|nr:transposase [Acidobacteriota bacterium]
MYALVAEHWPCFVERADAHGGLPKFVVDEFDAYLRCGILDHGLVQLACRGCGHEMVVAFSCKRRGFCPSCLGRRMSDIAAHLVDEVLPEVPIRQWVCTLPWRLRYAMGYDRKLCADVLGAFIGALTRSLRWRAKRELNLRSVRDARVGAVTFVQRADSALRLNVHFHTLALDGVYVRDEDRQLQFCALSAPSTQDVAQVAAWTHASLLRVLERHGRTLEGVSDSPDTFADDHPVLASCYGASAADVQLLGADAGQKTAKLIRPLRLVDSRKQGALAEVGGVNIHAEVVVDGRDRQRLERLCRYIARPPLSLDRLEQHPDGRVRVRFKSAWKDGTHCVLLEPLDFISRLCALIPPPRFHMLRYHGVLAGHSNDRAEVVPQPDEGTEAEPVEQLCLFELADDAPLQPPPAPSRHPWAWLLQRVFAVDVMTCPMCEGAMKLVTIATEPDDILDVLGNLPPARAPPLNRQLELDFVAA